MYSTSASYFALIGLLTVLPACDQPHRNAEAFDLPADPLTTFQLEDGFQIELVAGEPLIADPVAMEVDETGQVYVLEMPGYPLDVSPSGRVRVLHDSDGDGVLDQSSIFAEGFVLPTGLMRWKNGLLVTAPPDVLFIADTDGDSKADVREVVLSGFARSNPQHNFNKPLYGLDNWIYLANNGTIGTTDYAEQFGGRGGEVFFSENPAGPRLGRNANDRNVRFKPDSFELESLAGRSQFGHTFDAWGHHFLVDNSHPQYHEVIAARYLEKNPQLNMRMAVHYTPTYDRNAAIYPVTRNPEHQLLTDRGMITSASGITHYVGGLFPDQYRNISIVGESVHNLVHVLKVREDGPTFTATRLHDRKEFLASTDSWFRPVNFYVGPDGALYVIDYYRQIVEHPEWMDEETASSGRLQNGKDMGRIYRISPSGTAPAAWMNRLDLAESNTEELIGHLESENAWWRLNAQRLLVDRQDTQAADALEHIARNSEMAEARLHALWTLEGLGRLTGSLIVPALKDPHPGVRENAVVLAELHFQAGSEVEKALYELEKDPHPRVRLQLLCTLGLLDTPAGAPIRRRLLTADIDNSWMQLAALGASESIDIEYLTDLLPTLTHQQTEGRAIFLQRLASLVVAGGETRHIDALESMALVRNDIEWWQLAVLRGMAEGLRRADPPASYTTSLRDRVVAAFTSSEAAAPRSAHLALLEALPADINESVEAAMVSEKTRALDAGSATIARAQAIEMLAYYAADEHAEAFRSLVAADQPQEVQLASVRALGNASDPQIASFFVESWATMTPPVRDAALDQMMRSEAGMSVVLEALENNVIQPSAIGWNRTVRLMRDTEGAVRDQARALLSEPPGVREQIVEEYYASLNIEGQTDAGRVVFENNCSTCHQMAGELGTAFGPDLSTVRHWSPRALLAKILMPQRTIADGYGLWAVERAGGSTENGLLIAESSASVTLRRQGQPDLTIPRNEVVSIESMNVSAMPAGFEQQISKQEMADLIAFLRFN